MTNGLPTLEALRKEIDAIDENLHALLVRRAEIARTVATVKPRTNLAAPVMHVAREASILRRLVAKGGVKPQSVRAIWREIISASLQSQTPFHLHIFADGASSALPELARAHFGSLTPMRAHTKLSMVLHACAEETDSFGILPVPQFEEAGPAWWAQLSAPGQPGPRIMARLPFLAGEANVDAYVIGAGAFENSGDDTTLLMLEIAADLSRASVQDMLKDAGLEAQIIAAAPTSTREGAPEEILAALSGFVASTDPRLAVFMGEAGGVIQRAVLVGGYANPIQVETPQVETK